MLERLSRPLDRRGFLLGSGVLGAGALLSACTSNSVTHQAANAAVESSGAKTAPGKHVTIGFSAPAADHGWTGAISTNARAQAKLYSDVSLQATEGTNDVNAQIAAVQTLINKKVNALVILPFDGKALTQVAKQAMDAGIPVVNLDRIFDSPASYRTWIGGDNYGMGYNAGQFIAKRLKAAGTSQPVIAEVAGLDNLELTQQRSKGFRDSLNNYGLSIAIRQAAEFTVESGRSVMSNVLQAKSHLDAVWNHDDDQGIGVEAAIQQAGRSEFFMVGGAGSKHVMDAIKADKSVIKATVLYSPSMSASAITLGRLIAQNNGMSDLVEHEVPASITTFSAVVTKDNVDQYLPVGFA